MRCKSLVLGAWPICRICNIYEELSSLFAFRSMACSFSYCYKDLDVRWLLWV